MHYVVIITIIALIVIWQFKTFFSTKEKLNIFKNVFPDDENEFQLVQDDFKNSVLGIESKHNNIILNVIISSINKYLINNMDAVSDFHLMKDIVDRNCDAKEEEIQSQIPVPLYLGLVGTMAGILVGIGFLVIGGGLNDLLGTEPSSIVKFFKNFLQVNNEKNGIEMLMGGVSLAMISSIIGILLTTYGSYIARNAKANVEKNKNTFLSWMQAKLLPNIPNNTSSALVRMTKNLSNFNNTFAQNTQDLRNTLSKVNDSYKLQADVMQAINRLRIGDIATANIEVYNKLKNSTNEIGVFGEYLKESNKYLSTIQALSQKLDDYELRTQVIENAGRFFSKNEKWLAENIDIANLEVKAAIERFKENTAETLTKLQESLNGQILNFDSIMQRQQEKLLETLTITTEIVTESFTKTQQAFEKAISDQQNALKGKLQETSKLVEELKNLTHIKEGIKDFKEATNRQSEKIEELAKEIRALAKAKIEGGTIKQEITLPKWIKILIISGSSLFAVACLFYIVPILIEWITNLINWLF